MKRIRLNFSFFVRLCSFYTSILPLSLITYTLSIKDLCFPIHVALPSFHPSLMSIQSVLHLKLSLLIQLFFRLSRRPSEPSPAAVVQEKLEGMGETTLLKARLEKPISLDEPHCTFTGFYKVILIYEKCVELLNRKWSWSKKVVWCIIMWKRSNLAKMNAIPRCSGSTSLNVSSSVKGRADIVWGMTWTKCIARDNK